VAAHGGEVAHLKMTLDSGGLLGQLAAVSVVQNDQQPDLREVLQDRITGGELILNLRAELAPETLADLVADVLARATTANARIRIELEHQEQFRPARPVPTHRIEIGSSSEPAD
jgi:hypothetical protein